MFEIPPIFKIIKDTTNTDYREMYQVFNMGHRMEIITDDITAKNIIDIANKYEIEGKIVGYTEKSDDNKVEIHTPEGILSY